MIKYMEGWSIKLKGLDFSGTRWGQIIYSDPGVGRDLFPCLTSKQLNMCI